MRRRYFPSRSNEMKCKKKSNRDFSSRARDHSRKNNEIFFSNSSLKLTKQKVLRLLLREREKERAEKREKKCFPTTLKESDTPKNWLWRVISHARAYIVIYSYCVWCWMNLEWNTKHVGYWDFCENERKIYSRVFLLF